MTVERALVLVGEDSLVVREVLRWHLEAHGFEIVETDDGVEATYGVSKDAAVDTEHGLVEGAKYTAKEGDHVVVHYSEDAGHKVVHFLKHI